MTDQKLTLWQSLFSLAVEHDIDARERGVSEQSRCEPGVKSPGTFILTHTFKGSSYAYVIVPPALK